MTVFEKIEDQQKKEPHGSVAWCVAVREGADVIWVMTGRRAK